MSYVHPLTPLSCSLEIVQREFDDWVRHKLQQMNALVTTATEVVQREVDFVEGFPLQTLLSEDATALLKEADILVAKQVGCINWNT